MGITRLGIAEEFASMAVARDLWAVGVRVNCIAPGLIHTPIYGEGEGSEAFKDKLKKDVLFPKRLGSPRSSPPWPWSWSPTAT